MNYRFEIRFKPTSKNRSRIGTSGLTDIDTDVVTNYTNLLTVEEIVEDGTKHVTVERDDSSDDDCDESDTLAI